MTVSHTHVHRFWQALTLIPVLAYLMCAAGSIAASDCTCKANFYGANNVCTACNANAASPAGECQQPSILTCKNTWQCGKLLGLVPESC